MSRYIPTFDGSNRWLEDGKTLPSATLKSELDAVATAENANALVTTGASDLTFKIGFGVRYNVGDIAVNKACASEFDSDVNTYFISDAATLPSGALDMVAGDTVDDFQTIYLDKTSPAFGKRHMLIQCIAYGFDATAAATNNVYHPAASNTVAAQQIVIRENSQPSSFSDGQHPFAAGLTLADLVDATTNYASYNATETQRGSVAIRNLNNAFMYRIGTTLIDGGATAELVFRIMDAWD